MKLRLCVVAAALLPLAAHADTLTPTSASSGNEPSVIASPAFVESADVSGGDDSSDQEAVKAPPASSYVGEPYVALVTAPAGSVTPEPSSLLLLGTGMAGLVGMARRRRLS